MPGRAARAEKHDIDRLRTRFQVSFEQVCHRLSTLQRPGWRGVPFYFARVDMAGNITKRHSARCSDSIIGIPGRIYTNRYIQLIN